MVARSIFHRGALGLALVLSPFGSRLAAQSTVAPTDAASRGQILSISVIYRAPSGEVRVIAYTQNNPDPNRDINNIVALYFGTAAGQTPVELLGGWYTAMGMTDKANLTQQLWTTVGPRSGLTTNAAPILLDKQPTCTVAAGN